MTREIGTDAVISKVRLQHQTSHPSAPASGFGYLYLTTGTANGGLVVEDPSGNKYTFLTGSAAVLKTTWNVDAPPASPSALDDEFSGGSNGMPGSGLWTEFDPNNILTPVESSTYKNLSLSCATRAGRNQIGIYQTIPTGSFTIWTRCSFMTYGINYTLAGLVLWENATDTSKRLMALEMVGRSGGINLGLYKYTNSTTFDVAVYESTTLYLPNVFYLRLRRNATNYYWGWSVDGYSFMELTSSAYNPAFTPLHFGIGIENVASGETVQANFDFFRYVNSDVGLTGVLSGRTTNIYL